MESMLVHCLAPEYRGHLVRRACLIERISGGRTTSQDTLWIEMPELSKMPQEDDAEPFISMALLPAMAEGRDLHIKGAVSKRLLSNLTEFRDIWHSWKPGLFERVEFDADRLLERSTPGESRGAVGAFSGGLDSTFTIWRHRSGEAGLRALDLTCCIFVHGFDIPVWKEEPYTRIFTRCRDTLKTLELRLYPVRTNCRDVITLDWRIWHGPALAACLQLFKGVCTAGVLANTHTSTTLVFPWGSNPVTDPLLSTSGFEIIHDGIAFSRLQKLNSLRSWEAGYDNMRVCFTGIDLDTIQEGNCGKCTKCVRTLLVIQFARLPLPRSFSSPATAADIFKLSPSGVLAHGWRVTLKEAIKEKQPVLMTLAIAWIYILSNIASLVKWGLQKIGYWEPSFP